MDCNIELLFPTPVMFGTIDKEFTKEELNFINKHSKLTNKNVGNITSNNNYILKEPEMNELHKIILEYVKKYINTIYKPKYKIEPYITQSWLNYTNKNEYHHKHEHPNSFVSGVLYISADETKDKITFHKSKYNQIQLESDSYDVYNSESWWFHVKTKGIVLFPSSLTHHVENVISEKTRISLAFNTFICGTIGDNKSLTELINA